jgi:hypothetical protein
MSRRLFVTLSTSAIIIHLDARKGVVNMEFLRDQFWQGVGAVTAILALLLYIYVERDKFSKLYSAIVTQLRNTLGHLSNIVPDIVGIITTALNILILLLLAFFILFAPIFLYGELHQPSSINSSINNSSIFYGLIILVWCLSIITINHKLTIDKLREQIDYLNRVPGIKELKNSYNRKLFDSVITQWNDFSAELASKHDNSPFALDLVVCSPLDVQEETLIIGCPNKVIHKRMNVGPRRSSSDGNDDEYKAWRMDKKSIEGVLKDHFQVKRISYTLKEEIAA